jgi:hypothetical protein
MSDCTYTAGRREFLVLLASGVAISAWALFPSTVESGIYVPLPEMSAPSPADVAKEAAVAGPVTVYRLINAKLLSSKPTMYGSATVRNRGPGPVVNVSAVPLRSKLQALLMLLYSQSGDVDPAALEAKLQALLKLPDSVLAQLMQHPDLADLNKMLDAVFQGTSDLSGVKTELDKIDVTSVPTPTEQIDVIKVNGKPAYIVHTPAAQKLTENVAGSPVSVPPAPGAPVTVTVLSQVLAPAGLIASAFALAPSSEPMTSAPTPSTLIATDFTAAPSSEPMTSAPTPTTLIATDFTAAPSSQPLSPTSASPPPSSSAEPTGTTQTSQDIMTSGNKFEPGETATQPSGENSSATQTATPSTSPTGQTSPADGVTNDGGVTSPSNNVADSTSSSSAGEATP